VLVEPANDARTRSFQNPDYESFHSIFGLAFGVACTAAKPRDMPLSGYPDQHPIAMQGFLHVPCGDKNILVADGAVIRPEESIAVAVAGENSGNQGLLGGECVLSPLDAVNDALGVQFIQAALKTATLIAVEVEKSHHIPECESPALVAANELQYFLLLRG
jgi:hypothetical protein